VHAQKLAVGVLAIAVSTLALIPAHADDTAAYTVYKVGFNGGEPSIGYDNVHDVAIFGAGLSMEKLSWDDSQDPPVYTNTAVPKPKTDVTTLDAITAVDPAGSYALGDSTLQYSLFQTLVTIPYSRIRHHRQYAAPNQDGFTVTVQPATS